MGFRSRSWQASYDLGLDTTILEVAPHLMPVQLDLDAGKTLELLLHMAFFMLFLSLWAIDAIARDAFLLHKSHHLGL